MQHVDKKCMIFKCYSSEELIALNTLHEVVPTWYSYHSWVDWGNADNVHCSRTQHTDAGFEPSTTVSISHHSIWRIDLSFLTSNFIIIIVVVIIGIYKYQVKQLLFTIVAGISIILSTHSFWFFRKVAGMVWFLLALILPTNRYLLPWGHYRQVLQL